MPPDAVQLLAGGGKALGGAMRPSTSIPISMGSCQYKRMTCMLPQDIQEFINLPRYETVDDAAFPIIRLAFIASVPPLCLSLETSPVARE